MKLTEIERLLPGVFQRVVEEGTPLFGILSVMEDLHATDEVVLHQLDAFFDPYRTPDSFVPFLAGWVDLAWLLRRSSEDPTTSASFTIPSGLGRLRELIAVAAYLAQWRGTAKGLIRFLETATGVQGFTIEEQVLDASGLPIPFHMQVHVPKQALTYQMMIEQIIEMEKPAYVTYELQVAQ